MQDHDRLLDRRVRSLVVLRLLVDTSVWLDLAKSKDGQALIVSLRVLTHGHRLELMVPQVVIDEFERFVRSVSCSPRARASIRCAGAG